MHLYVCSFVKLRQHVHTYMYVTCSEKTENRLHVHYKVWQKLVNVFLWSHFNHILYVHVFKWMIIQLVQAKHQ